MNSAEHDRLRELLIALEGGDVAGDAALRAELNELLRSNPQARDRYLDHIEVQAVLHGRYSTPLVPEHSLVTGTDGTDGEIQHDEILSRRRPWVVRSTQSIIRFFARPTPLSMSVAALVVGLLITAMAFMSAPFYRAVAAERVAARLTGMHDAQWGPQHAAMHLGMPVHRGEALHLVSGLIELQCESGVGLVVRGPAKVSLSDDDLVQLQSGAAAVSVPPEAAGFRVHTPHARIVDLGTKFGVFSDATTTEVQVFEGRVEATLLNVRGVRVSTQRLAAGQVLRWNAVAAARQSVEGSAYAFALALPQRERLPIKSTGLGLAQGDVDPHWDVVAAQGAGEFQPGPAKVTAPNPAWLAGDAERSQWISFAAEPTSAPAGSMYTFRTQFEIQELDASTAQIVARIASDDAITAIRLNGQPVQLPAESTHFTRFTLLRIEGGFQQGMNALEFDIHNDGDGSPVGLRVDWAGFAFSKVEMPGASNP